MRDTMQAAHIALQVRSFHNGELMCQGDEIQEGESWMLDK